MEAGVEVIILTPRPNLLVVNSDTVPVRVSCDLVASSVQSRSDHPRKSTIAYYTSLFESPYQTASSLQRRDDAKFAFKNVEHTFSSHSITSAGKSSNVQMGPLRSALVCLIKVNSVNGKDKLNHFLPTIGPRGLQCVHIYDTCGRARTTKGGCSDANSGSFSLHRKFDVAMSEAKPSDIT